MKTKTFTLIIAFLISTPLIAGWSSVNKVDEFIDVKVRFAVYVDNKHRIQISHEGKSVWMFITKSTHRTFEPNSIIELRVDKNKTRIYDPEKYKALASLGIKGYQWEPSNIGFLIWHGKENEGCGFIGELIAGNELKGRYRLSSLERETFSISLAGARQVLIDGLDLRICGK